MNNNSTIFKEGLTEYVNTYIKPTILMQLYRVAEAMVVMIDNAFKPYPIKVKKASRKNGNIDYPIWTANMHDSTGIGVYADGTLKKYLPTEAATITQTDGGTSGIVGSVYLNYALDNARGQFATGIWIVLFSAVPYAYRIDKEGSKLGRGQNFFGKLTNNFIYEVFANLEPITAEAAPDDLFL